MPYKKKISNQQIADAVRESRGNISEACRLLRVSPGALPARIARSESLENYVAVVRRASVVPISTIPRWRDDEAPAAAAAETV